MGKECLFKAQSKEGRQVGRGEVSALYHFFCCCCCGLFVFFGKLFLFTLVVKRERERVPAALASR